MIFPWHPSGLFRHGRCTVSIFRGRRSRPTPCFAMAHRKEATTHQVLDDDDAAHHRRDARGLCGLASMQTVRRPKLETHENQFFRQSRFDFAKIMVVRKFPRGNFFLLLQHKPGNTRPILIYLFRNIILRRPYAQQRAAS